MVLRYRLCTVQLIISAPEISIVVSSSSTSLYLSSSICLLLLLLLFFYFSSSSFISLLLQQQQQNLAATRDLVSTWPGDTIWKIWENVLIKSERELQNTDLQFHSAVAQFSAPIEMIYAPLAWSEKKKGGLKLKMHIIKLGAGQTDVGCCRRSNAGDVPTAGLLVPLLVTGRPLSLWTCSIRKFTCDSNAEIFIISLSISPFSPIRKS